MAEFPALPFYTDAYLADTRHLTTEEHGAYLLLLLCAWRTRGCALKDDDRFLARTVGVSPQRWRKLKPALMEFFDVSGGLWRQKKLTDVYRNVEDRVARNRANGAKGGRARASRERAAKAKAEEGRAQKTDVGPTTCQPTALATGKATKSQNPNPKPAAAAEGCDGEGGDEGDLRQVADAAGLKVVDMDASPLVSWRAAGADLALDILPVIHRLRARQEGKTGQRPITLAYYGQAVLEARDKRLKARATGRAHARDNPPAPPKRPFDANSHEDWACFLGDAGNRFRGDYLSANWHIGTDHPVFLPASLGHDPRARFNPLIPDAVHRRYGQRWRWVTREGATITRESDSKKDTP